MAKKKSKKSTALEKARDVGYRQGWQDGDNLPSTIGAVSSAKASYGRGITARRKAMKIEKEIDEREKKIQKLKNGK